MKIMIAYPPLISAKGIPLLAQNRQFQWFNSPTFIYPVVPAYAATMLKKAGHQVVWADGIAQKQSEDDFLELIKKENPDLIVIESKTPVITRHWKFINYLKTQALKIENCPLNADQRIADKLKTVLVGDHVTALPEESMQKCAVDYILTGGDYDFLLVNLVNHLTKGEKLEAGIWYRTSSKSKAQMSNPASPSASSNRDESASQGGQAQNPNVSNIKNFTLNENCKLKIENFSNTGHFLLNHDLNKLPMIDRELTQWKLYAYDNGNYKYTPGTYTMAARDCWWGKCTFCSWTTLYPKYRRQSAKKMLDEIGILIDKYHIKEIMDDSGSFPVGAWLREFCQGMIKRGYNKKIAFDCNMRFGTLTQAEWNLMAKAGFRFILFGLESANQKTLDKINKNIKVADIEKGLTMAKKAGLEPHITAMMGYPWETRADAQKTVNLAKKMFDCGLVDTLQATIVIPYPGTPLYKYCLENNLLKFNDYDRFDQREQVMKSPLTTKDVQELTQDLYKAFMTPKFIWRKISNIKSWSDIKFLARAGGKVLGHLTDFSHKNQQCECENEEGK
ncbi:MAG: B12-binding domain-containing radical SAM protein [Patescibacteria group bacterium]|nr:B12-binding domain-containing radical SAM protein [Patescibacteria group bacterium]